MEEYIIQICNKHNKDYQNINIYHWSSFEPNILCRMCTKLDIIYPILKWTDILTLFHSEPIIIKGALDFSLKTVGKAMYKLKLIKTIWPTRYTNISDGLNAMYEAYKIYNINDDILKHMKPIIKYNEVDCKIMWDILNALDRIA